MQRKESTDGSDSCIEAILEKAGNSLGIEDGVPGVHGSIVLGRLTNQTLLIGEGDERWRGEGALLVGDDFDIGALVRSNARVGGA